MANRKPKTDHLAPHQFKPGQSANPGGKPKGARNRITAAFLEALADDFQAHGREAIAACRTETPHRYVATIAGLCPRHSEAVGPLDEITDDELSALIAALRLLLAEQDARDSDDRAPKPDAAVH